MLKPRDRIPYAGKPKTPGRPRIVGPVSKNTANKRLHAMRRAMTPAP